MTARPNVQMLDINQPDMHEIDAWKAACGFPTDNAAAMALRVDRHTIPNWRKRDLTHVERLALAAVYHRIKPFGSEWKP